MGVLNEKGVKGKLDFGFTFLKKVNLNKIEII